LPCNIVACRENATADGEWQVFQFGPIELFDSGIEGVAVKMDHVLGEVAGKLEPSNESVGLAQLARQVKLLEAVLLVEDSIDLHRKDPVSFLFAIEIFGALGGAVYDLRDLPTEAAAGGASVTAAAFRHESASRHVMPTFLWSTESWPAFVNDGPRREYFKEACWEAGCCGAGLSRASLSPGWGRDVTASVVLGEGRCWSIWGGGFV
jgi:hypothetical protein